MVVTASDQTNASVQQDLKEINVKHLNANLLVAMEVHVMRPIPVSVVLVSTGLDVSRSKFDVPDRVGMEEPVRVSTSVGVLRDTMDHSAN